MTGRSEIHDGGSETVASAGRPEAAQSPAYVATVLIAGYAVYNLDRAVLAVLIEPLKAEFQMNDFQVSLLTGLALTVPLALASIPLGKLADKVRRIWLLAVLLVGWSVSTALSGLAGTLAILFMARMGVGLFEAGFTPTTLSLLSDTFPRHRRATVMGLYGLGSPVGIVIAMALGGLVAAELGWRAAFFMAGVPGLLIAALILLTIREPVRGRFDPEPAVEQARPFRAALDNVWRDKALLHLMLGMVSCGAVAAALSVWTPSFLVRVHGLSLKEAGIAGALVVGLCSALGATLGGALADRAGREHDSRRVMVVIAGTALSVIFGLAAFLLAQGMLVTVTLLGFMAVFTQFFFGPGYALAASRSPVPLRATTMAILSVGFSIISYGVGHMLVGVVSDLLSGLAGREAIAWGLAATLGFNVMGCVFFWCAIRSMRKPHRGVAP